MTLDDFLKPTQEPAEVPTFVINRGVNGWVLGLGMREFYVAGSIDDLLSIARSLLTAYDSQASAKRRAGPGGDAIAN